MKRLFSALTICLMLLLASCQKPADGGMPSITLTAVDATSSSVTFVINIQNATECAYMLYEGGSVDVDRVFADGVKTKGGIITIEELQPNTEYNIAAAARNGRHKAMAQPLRMTTMAGSGDDNNDDGNVDDGGNEDDGGNDDGNHDIPDIDGVETITITKTANGRWYEVYNFYVTLVRDNGDELVFDLYTIDETMSSYLPYGQYILGSGNNPYTLNNESSRYVPKGVAGEDGYYFTDGYVSVDVEGGYYSLYFLLTYDMDGVSKSVQGYYNGLLSGAAVPEGDNEGSKRLIEVLDIGSTSFKFRINAEEGQYWRCSVVDKRVYDQKVSNPGAWVVTYGFMLEGTLTFNWENGKMCEHVPGYPMNVSSSTDYLILAALMDYSNGEENNLMGGVEIVNVHTKADALGVGTVDIKVKEINSNDVTIDCTLGENVWCCYVAIMETANLEDVKNGGYAVVGYGSFEECMMSLIPGLSYDSMRQFLESQVDYKWDYLKYNTSYTICAKVVDMNNGATYVEIDPFTTKLQ